MKKALLLAITLFISALAVSQTTIATITQLRAGMKGPEITLSWKDETGLKGVSYLVYRHTAIIDWVSFSRAQLIATIDDGSTNYTYSPPDKTPYFFAVLIRDSTGKVLLAFKPAENSMATGIAVTEVRPQELAVADSDTEAASEVEVPLIAEAKPPEESRDSPKEVVSSENTADGSADDGLRGIPTMIRLGLKGNQVILTWFPGVDTTGGFYLVFRNKEMISADNIDEALLIAELPSTIFEYIDTPPESSVYFYAVLFKKADGTVVRSFVPLENVSNAGVSVKKTEIPVKAESSLITGIKAKADGSGIRISYSTALPGQRLVIYRSVTPIVDMKTLLESSLIAVFTDSGEAFTDYPVPGIDYYYAIIEEEKIKSGLITLIPNANSTTAPVLIPAGAYRVGLPAFAESFMRSMPLPFLALSRDVSDSSGDLPSGLTVPDRMDLTPETLKALADVSKGLPEPGTVSPAPALLPEDMLDAAGNEDYTLKLILREQFMKANYQGTIVQLQKFLSIYRTPAIEARAHYYLGQSFAMLGYYREAFFEFLQAQEFHYQECQLWIDFLLTRLHRSNDGHSR